MYHALDAHRARLCPFDDATGSSEAAKRAYPLLRTSRPQTAPGLSAGRQLRNLDSLLVSKSGGAAISVAVIAEASRRQPAHATSDGAGRLRNVYDGDRKDRASAACARWCSQRWAPRRWSPRRLTDPCTDGCWPSQRVTPPQQRRTALRPVLRATAGPPQSLSPCAFRASSSRSHLHPSYSEHQKATAER